MRKADAVLAAKLGIGLYMFEGSWFEAFAYDDDSGRLDLQHLEDDGKGLLDSEKYAHVVADYIYYGQFPISHPLADEPIVVVGFEQPFVDEYEK